VLQDQQVAKLGKQLSSSCSVSMEVLEEPLKNYPFLRGVLKKEVDEFYTRLPEPYKSFFKFRYMEQRPMEQVAEKLNYCTRSMYVFRKKILEWWAIWNNKELEKFPTD